MNDENENNFEYEEKPNVKNVVSTYGGAIIGAFIALILCFTEMYKILVYCVIVIAGAVLGNYVQKNKSVVKEKLKNIIDRF